MKKFAAISLSAILIFSFTGSAFAATNTIHKIIHKTAHKAKTSTHTVHQAATVHKIHKTVPHVAVSKTHKKKQLHV